MSNQTDADKTKLAAEEASRKDAEAKAAAAAEAKAKQEPDAKVAAEKRFSEKSTDRPAKPAEPTPSHADPHPTQAELDAMRDGTYRHGREAKADAKGLEYKTR